MGRVAVAVLLLAVAAPAENLTRTAKVLLILIQASGQSSTPSSPQPGGQASPEAINVLRRQGMDAFRAGDYAGALRIFRQVIAADPSDIVAYNVSANCSLRLGDYRSAIDSFQHALQLRPDEWHNLSGLMRAYTLAGMTPERDALRKHIAELEHEGKLPPEFSYIFETFQAGDKKVEVAEFPQIHGFYGERYRFKVFTSTGKQVFCVTLESNSLDQPTWAKQHPKEAAAGGRGFSLDGYATDAHYTYDFYDGEPPYEQVREEVLQVLGGKKHAMSKTTYATPQPIPGAE
jgi:tetratricopeptide (TPR) repeat protein